MTPSYPTATRTRSQGMVFLFRWPCYQIQADTPVDVWSNHACQVALFFPPATERHVKWVCKPRSSPASGNAPLGKKKGYVNQQAASCPRSAKAGLSRWSCCHWILGKECTLLREKARVRAVGPSFSQRATSREFRDTVGKTCRTSKKSKDKGKRPIQRRIAKGTTSRSPS